MKYILFLIFSISFYYQVEAQLSLSVKVIDIKNKEVLAYANIYLKNNKIGSSTDLDGQVILQLPQKENVIIIDTLICSFVGYKDTSLLVNLRETSYITIELQPDIIALDEVVVSNQSENLQAKQILKKSFKNIKINYPQKATIIKGFYRELVKEEEKYIQLNEAFFELFYTPYPQRKYTKKAWNAYFETYSTADNYPSDKYAIFRNAQLLKYWNTVKDQCKIVAARSSSDWSKDEVEIIAENGPLDLSAIDKVKYQADFLDPRLVKRYEYNKIGATHIEGEPCYILNFKPKKLKRTESQDVGKKVKIPIFSGRLYISMNDFAITKFECQLTQGAIPETRYRVHMPSSISLDCNYQKINKKWHLKSITAKQFLTSYTSTRIKHIKELKREFWVKSIQLDQVKPFSLSFETSFLDRRKGNIRYFPINYDSVFWKNPSAYVQLPTTVIRDLTTEISLEQQFKERFFKKDLPPPIYPILEDTTLIHQDTLINNYQWLRGDNDSLVQIMISQENKYFKNSFTPYRGEFAKANYDITYQTQRCDRGLSKSVNKISIGFSTLGKFGIIFKNDKTNKLLVDYDDLCAKCQIRSFFASPDTSFLAYTIASPEGINLYIKDLKKDRIVANLGKINDMKWLSNELILYLKQDATRRTYLIGSFSIANQLHKVLKKTDSSSKEIEYLYRSQDMDYYFFVENDGDFNKLLRVNNHGELDYLLTQDKTYTLQLDEDKTYWYALVRDQNWVSSIIRKSKKDDTTWELFLSSKENEMIDNFKVSSNYLAVYTISNAIPHLNIHPKQKVQQRTEIKFPSKFFNITFDYDQYLGQDSLQLYYSSLNELSGIFTLDLKTSELSYEAQICYNEYFVKQLPVYKTDLIQVPSIDNNATIPLRISRNVLPGMKYKGIILKAYGAYGAFSPSSYDKLEALLMDRGYILAHAYIRGSRAKGWKWYKEGKMQKKIQGIDDYISCVKYLSTAENLSTQQIIAYGQSAGGMLIAAAVNKKPELFKAVILDYPYLDVINTMLDESLPLTSLEYQEWGNPKNTDEYEYIRRYSPYQNITKQNYPPILLFTGQKDFQTPYWQVLSSVAKYRAYNQNSSEILVQINNNGHVGSYPYNQRIKEIIYQFLFLEKHLNN